MPSVEPTTTAPPASDRFELRGQLGSGGMGVVHRVLDRGRGREVALKVLRGSGGRELYRFKREFRALADLAHPNLVELYELYTVGDEWMFTMELVDGVTFHEWVRPLDRRPGDDALFGGEWTAPARGATPVPLGDLDEARLREALRQLADGLCALHAAGKLHRDVKPTNVLVEPGGRVVVLDFGLIAEVDAFHVDRTHERAAVGTPAYMSPEQAADRPLTDASDWYAVGAMLYEALTARRPFEGSADEVLTRKQREDPPPPSAVADGVPADLEALCVRLLARDPLDRPSGAAVLAAVGAAPSAATARIAQQVARGPFVGRADELAALRRAAVDARHRCTATLVLGASGMGKTALVRAFLDEASVDGEAVILEGRCYEREAVPYKALDQVIDGLTAYLVRLSRPEIERLVPADVAALVRLFPVMKRVPGLVRAPALPGALPGDPIELRRRAIGALREILGEIAETRAVVAWIDDLQWGDVDGVWALAELMREPGAPRMQVIVGHRDEDAAETSVLARLRGWYEGELRELRVGALRDRDARELWHALGGREGDREAVADAAGSPLLLAEIARARAAGGARVTSVDEAVQARAARLDGDARALLHAVATAVRPMTTRVAQLAAGLDDATAAVATLRMERLVRTRGGGGEPTVEPYHDRIREAVGAAMTAEERRAAHAGIARALTTSEHDEDGEALLDHWLGAGDVERASRAATRAAREAAERFAFHRAAELYAVALQHGQVDGAARCALTARRAEALAAAGRLLEAAVEFRAAASLAHGRQRFALERRSVEQLLRAGHLDRGLAAAQELLGAVGVTMPTTWRRTVLALAVERARIRMRGLDYVERAEADVAPELLERLDVLWSVSSGFTFVNPVVGRVLQARLLRESLAAGELRRVIYGLTLELGYHGMAGEKARDRCEEMLARTRGLAARLGRPEVAGFVEAGAGIASYLAGRFREAHDRMVAGELLMRRDPTEMQWQLDLSELFRLSTLWYLGELQEILRLQPQYLRAAEERGNVYAQRGLRGWRSNVVWLIRDEPAEARAQAERAAPGRGEAFHLHHYYDVLCQTMIDLYEDDGEAGFARVEGAARELERSHLLRIQSVDVEWHWLRGAAAVTAARHDRARLAVADACVARLERIASPCARVFAAQLRASLAAARGAREAAIESLRAAIASAELAEMSAHRAAAQLRLSTLVPGPDAPSLRATALTWLADQGATAPLRLVRLLTPTPSPLS